MNTDNNQIGGLSVLKPFVIRPFFFAIRRFVTSVSSIPR